jgi:uncharacterized membrane protein
MVPASGEAAPMVATPTTPPNPPNPPPPLRPWAIAALVALILAFLYAVGGLSVAGYRLYVKTWDLAILNQAAWLLSHGQGSFLTTRGLTIFGHHLHLALWPLVALYRLWPGPQTLLWAQACAMSLLAVPVFALARELYRSDAIALAWAAVALANPALQSVALHEFHMPPFATPLLATALYLAHRRQWRGYAVMLGLALLTQEDAGLALLALGVGLALAGERKVGLWTALCGLAYTVAAVKVVMPWCDPALRDPYYVQQWFGQLGGGMVGVALAPLLHTRAWAGALFTGTNGLLLVNLLAPLAGLCLFKPSWAAGAAVTLYANMLTSFWPAHTIAYHYTAYINPFLIMGAVAGGRWLAERLEAGGCRRPVALATPVVMALLATFVLPPVTGGRAFPLSPTSPLRTPIYVRIYARNHSWSADCDRLVATIPPTASVSADMNLLSQVSGRVSAWWFPEPFAAVDHNRLSGPPVTVEEVEAGLRRAPADYILLLTKPGLPVPLDPDTHAAAVRAVEGCGRYECVGDVGAVRLYRRRGSGD